MDLRDTEEIQATEFASWQDVVDVESGWMSHVEIQVKFMVRWKCSSREQKWKEEQVPDHHHVKLQGYLQSYF
jgi:hypothetical protein